MRKEQFYETVGDIDDKLINEADKPVRVTRRRWQYIAAAAACLVLCVGAGAVLNKAYRDKLPNPTLTVEREPDSSSNPEQQTKIIEVKEPEAAQTCKVLAEAVYPEMPAYPEPPIGGSEKAWDEYGELEEVWWEANRELLEQPEGYDKGIDNFFRTSTGVFMTGQNSKNKVYSPLSLYMALGMTAEVSEGNTRKQILDVLGQDNIEEMRSHAASVWKSSYKNDGMATCVIANSLWANSKFPCKQSTADSLAENYYASAFSGDPASEEYNAMFREWLNKQTDGLLSDYTKEMKMEPETILSLASTVNFAGKWLNEFSAENNEKGVFHSPDGDKDVEYMKDMPLTNYWTGKNYSAISLSFEYNGTMRLILPKEGVSPEELFKDEETLKFMMANDNWDDGEYCGVHLSLPKFDISSGTDLTDGLKAMGITDVFDSTVSDFTPITDEVKDIVISKAEQDARVMIDEEGCRAAAMTVEALMGAGGPSNEVDFVLDRPFVFEIMGDNGLPLFVGVVNDPS